VLFNLYNLSKSATDSTMMWRFNIPFNFNFGFNYKYNIQFTLSCQRDNERRQYKVWYGNILIETVLCYQKMHFKSKLAQWGQWFLVCLPLVGRDAPNLKTEVKWVLELNVIFIFLHQCIFTENVIGVLHIFIF